MRMQSGSPKNDVRKARFSEPLVCALVCLAIFACGLLVYHPVRYHGVTNCDDFYITENPQLERSAVNLENMIYVMTRRVAGIWMPAVTIFVGAEHILFGSDFGMYHMVCAFLHLANGIILFFLLRMMTGALWKSALVAALFIVHPLNVEPVAWLVGIRVVLCSFFCLLSVLFYVVYVRRGNTWLYLVSLFSYGFSTVVVPMYVPLACVLLLLDFWPLKRVDFPEQAGGGLAQAFARGGPVRALLWEKTPFFLFIAGMSAVVLGSHDLPDVYHYPFYDRVLNVPLAYLAYLYRIFFPANLSVFYPFPTSFPFWKVGGALLVLAGITASALLGARKYRFFITGWLWFLVMIFPLSGIVQIGTQAMADHYNYLPMIGILVAVVWGVETVAGRNRAVGVLCCIIAVCAVPAFAVISARQVAVWKDSFTLLEHALKVTRGNYVAHNYLGQAYAQKGDLDRAIHHFELALSIKPDDVKANYNIATVYLKMGDARKAAKHYTLCLLADPYSAQAHNSLGMALAATGDLAGAVKHYRAALDLAPGFYHAQNNLANALARMGRLDEAIENYRLALSASPSSPTILYNLADVLARKGRRGEAEGYLRKALSAAPSMAKARLRLADLLMEMGRPSEAAMQYLTLLSVFPNSAALHHKAGLALRASGDIAGADRHFEAARRNAAMSGSP